MQSRARESCYGFLVLFLFLVYLFSTVSVSGVLVSESIVPSRLKVYVGPPAILANRGVHDSIVVQLQDSRGSPARAQEDIVVSLTSSKADIGSVDPTCTIRAGDTYAQAKFYSTYTPGSTTITAVASGFPSEQASITTVGPIPSKLAVYIFPQKLPADGKVYDSVIVQLQDSGGRPARAPIGDTEVTLTSSNTDVGTIDTSLTIKSGNTYAIAKFDTRNFRAYEPAVGSTTITAMASGYESGMATLATSEVKARPSRLVVYVGPPKITAEGVVHDSISVQLQDSYGRVVKASLDTTVTLTSSNIAVGTVEPTLTISSRETSAVAKFYSTYRSGSTTITAAATGYISGQASIMTVGPIPSKLAVYGFPQILPADGKVYDSFIVQLQDAGGRPARDPVGNTSVTLSSSNTEIGNVSSTTTIPLGQTYVTTEFYSSYTAGSATITAVAPDYTSGKATIRTFAIDPPMNVSVTAYPASIKFGEQTTIRVYVTHISPTPTLPPVPGATIKLTSDKGGSFSSITDERNGYYSAVFTAPTVDTEMASVITASASKHGYASAIGQVKVTIYPPIVGGDILICVEDSKGNPVSQSTVASTSHPSGQPPLSGITNDTGSVMFNNVTDGIYVIEVNKNGYNTNSQLINVTEGQTTTVNINLLKEKPSGFLNPKLGFLTPPLLWVIAIAIVVGVIAIIIIAKR